jgi:hypothetical protein
MIATCLKMLHIVLGVFFNTALCGRDLLRGDQRDTL